MIETTVKPEILSLENRIGDGGNLDTNQRQQTVAAVFDRNTEIQTIAISTDRFTYPSKTV
jgi:hypothetical protein